MPFRSPSARTGWVVAALIFIGATIYCLKTNDIPATAFFGGDTWEYQSMAVNFASGHGMRVGGVLPFDRYGFGNRIDAGYFDYFMELGSKGGEERFYRTPVYPFLLGILYKLVGVRPDIAMLIQMLVMIGIGAMMPILGDKLLGWRGFVAGVPTGALVATILAPDVLSIMTEALIVFACFVTLVAWIRANERRNALSGLVLGVTLAFALLAKGSLIFIPPLLIAYMVVRSLQSGTYSKVMLLAVMLGFAVPVVAYSAWASSRSGETIVLSTQGRYVLLDGHNEYSTATGRWSPQWKDDPATFYSQELAARPDQSRALLVVRYYLEHPSDLPVGIVSRLEVLGRGTDPITLLAINGFLALCFFYIAMKALQPAGAGIRYTLLALILAGIVVSGADVSISLAGMVIVCVAGLGSRAFRDHLRAMWNNPLVVALFVISVNFLLLTLATFAEIRFVWPVFFVLLLTGFYLVMRLAEELEILPGLPLLPAKGRDRSAIGALYSTMRRATYRSVARELNPVVRYSDSLVYAGTSDDRTLFDLLESPAKGFQRSIDLSDAGDSPRDASRLVVLNGVFNSSLDIQELLSGMKPRLNRRDRLVAVLYNPYLRSLYTMLDRTGLRTAPPSTTFVTRRSLDSLASLSGYQLVRLRPAACFPFRLLGLGTLIDGIIKALPLIRHIALVNVAVLRPIIPEVTPPSLSVVVPARNEAGNIRAAIERMPLLPGVVTEVIFVEGGSTDDTAEEIRRVIESYDGPLKLSQYTQQGRGKGDAVRLGFAHATGDVLTILDADLTMPPEMLGRFYDAYREGLGDFVNGNRLLYPMEGEAMRFLNTLGNLFFSKLLAWILESPLNDTLCGTKVISRLDYERVGRWRDDFGDFDPFGDFELLFSAATMALGIVEVPVRYRARTYGTTNIHRFRHGLMLAKMSAIGFVRIKM